MYHGRWRRLVGDVVWSPHGYGVSDRMFFLVLSHADRPGQRGIKWVVTVVITHCTILAYFNYQ